MQRDAGQGQIVFGRDDQRHFGLRRDEDVGRRLLDVHGRRFVGDGTQLEAFVGAAGESLDVFENDPIWPRLVGHQRLVRVAGQGKAVAVPRDHGRQLDAAVEPHPRRAKLLGRGAGQRHARAADGQDALFARLDRQARVVGRMQRQVERVEPRRLQHFQPHPGHRRVVAPLGPIPERLHDVLLAGHARAADRLHRLGVFFALRARVVTIMNPHHLGQAMLGVVDQFGLERLPGRQPRRRAAKLDAIEARPDFAAQRIDQPRHGDPRAFG